MTFQIFLNSQIKTFDIKRLSISFLLVFASFYLYSQNTTNWSTYDIAFDSPSPLQKVEETKTFIDFDNENLAITIEATPVKETQLHQNNSIRVYTENLANTMNFQNIVKGESLNQFSQGYFVQAEDTDTVDASKLPVFIAIVFLEEFSLVFKIIIYCYHKNQEDGLQILRSLRFLN